KRHVDGVSAAGTVAACSESSNAECPIRAPTDTSRRGVRFSPAARHPPRRADDRPFHAPPYPRAGAVGSSHPPVRPEEFRAHVVPCENRMMWWLTALFAVASIASLASAGRLSRWVLAVAAAPL